MRYLFTLLIILLALPLVSFAPVPVPISLPLAIIVAHPALPARVIPQAQACSEQLARELRGPYLREVIVSSRGVPYGEVAAWSCTGDVQATIVEFARRKAQMIEDAQ